MSDTPWPLPYFSRGNSGARTPQASWQTLRQLERRRVLAADITDITISPDPPVEGDTISVGAIASGIGPLEFDWIVTRDSVHVADSFSSSVDFTALQDGFYQIQLTVTDHADQIADTIRFELEVHNALPRLIVADDQQLLEGSLLDLAGTADRPFLATFTDPGVLDTHTAMIDWGDGFVEAATIVGLDGSYGIAGSHTYGDNGNYTVKVFVTDDDGEAMASLKVMVENVAPTLVQQGPYTIDEGDLFTLDSLSGGVIGLSDPGFDNPLNVLDPTNGGETKETFTGMTIDWGDGTAPTDVTIVNRVSGSPGVPTTAGFEHEAHAYADNGTYTVTISFADDDGGVTHGQLTIIVNNVAPVLVLTDQSYEIDEGQTVTIDFLGSFSDPGFDNPLNSLVPEDDREVAESFTFEIDWNDGSPIETGSVSDLNGSKGVPSTGILGGFSHVYHDNDPDNIYHVSVTIFDDDGGSHTQVLDIRVNNVNPLLDPLFANDLGGDGITTLLLSFGDPGADTYEIVIDWGDFNPAGPQIIDVGSATGMHAISHYYSGPPNPADPTARIYITVQILDDDAKVPGVVQPGFSNIEVVSIKPPVATPPDPPLLPPSNFEAAARPLPQIFDVVPVTTVPVVATAQSQAPDVRSGGGDVAASSERFFVLVVVNPDGSFGDSFRLKDEQMNDLPGLFARLHDDHYRIYFVRTDNHTYRLVIDVVTRDGRMTVPGDVSSGIRDRPPEAVEAGQGDEPDQSPPPEAPVQLPPGALLEEMESGTPLPEGESSMPQSGNDLAATDVSSSNTRSTSAVATAALAAAAVAIDPRADWAVRLERAFASADPRRWRQLRRRRPR